MTTPDDGRLWAAFAAALLAASLVAWWLPAVTLDWQPALAAVSGTSALQQATATSA